MSTTYDLDKAIGYSAGTKECAWTTRDLLLYAVGIGATEAPEDLRLTYELSKDFAAFPTFPVVLPFKGANPEVIDFNKAFGGVPVPGLPKFNPGRIVHGSQSIEVLRPIPIRSGDGWTLKRTIVGVHENKSGVIVDEETVLSDPAGVPYTKMISSTFNVGAKANGTKFSKAIAQGVQPTKPLPKDKAPDHVIQEKIPQNQAILYRLSGDYNPLHVDSSVGQKAGFGGVILHGLCSYGLTARAIIKAVGGGDPNALKGINARFTSPVRLGDTLEVQLWEVGSGPNGTVEVAFVTKNVTTGKLCLGGGVAYVVKTPKSKL